MTQETSGGSTLLQAGYDYAGRRVWSVDSSGTKTYYVYDGMDPVSELNSTGTVIRNNAFGPMGLSVSNAPSYGSGSAGTGHYYIDDPQGSPALVVNDGSSAATAGVLTAFEDDAYGNRIVSNTATASDPYTGFGGEWGYRTDSSTGLELLGHRYYDPANGRFVNRDPIGYDGGNGLYGYVGDDPLTEIDVNGYAGCYIPEKGLPRNPNGEPEPSSPYPHTQLGRRNPRPNPGRRDQLPPYRQSRE